MPISELIYQPLKGAAGNSRPPISRSMLDTAGRAYQRRPRAANHSSLGFGVQISLCAELSCAPHSPSSKEGLQVAPRPPCPSCSRGVLQRHLEDQLWGQSEEFWGLIGSLE